MRLKIEMKSPAGKICLPRNDQYPLSVAIYRVFDSASAEISEYLYDVVFNIFNDKLRKYFFYLKLNFKAFIMDKPKRRFLISPHVHFFLSKPKFPFGNIKIDRLNCKIKVLHDVKKSDKMKDGNDRQVKYCIGNLETIGIGEFTDEINYPKFKNRFTDLLETGDEKRMVEIIKNIGEIKSGETLRNGLSKAIICKRRANDELCRI